MAKRQWVTVEAWRDPRDGALYAQRVFRPGAKPEDLPGNLPAKGPGTGTLPRLDELAEQLAQEGYRMDTPARAIQGNTHRAAFLRTEYESKSEQWAHERLQAARASKNDAGKPDPQAPTDQPSVTPTKREQNTRDWRRQIKF